MASESGTSILVEPDDRIVVAGSRGMGVVVARLEPEGALDDSFGTGGIFSQGLGALSHPKIERTATGAYRVMANASPTLEAGPRPTCTVLALTDSGLTDTGFSDDGMEFVFGSASATCDVFALQDDGKLLVGGSAGRLVRLLPDGTPDPVFRTDVVAEVLDSISALAVGSSGKIFVAGHDREGLAGPTILRLLADGTLDPAFGNDGSTRFNLHSLRPVDPVVHDMGVGTNDALVLAGGMWPFNGGFVARLLGDGPGAGPGIIGIDQASAFGTEQSGEALVTVRRMGGSAGAVAVSYVARSPEGFTATAGADYTPVTGRFDWADGDSSERQIVVPILPDALDESPEFFELVLESTEGGAGLGVHGMEVAIAGTSYPAGEFRFAQTGETVSEGSTYELWVTRDFYTSGEVSVTVRLAGGSARTGQGLRRVSGGQRLVGRHVDLGGRRRFRATHIDHCDEGQETGGHRERHVRTRLADRRGIGRYSVPVVTRDRQRQQPGQWRRARRRTGCAAARPARVAAASSPVVRAGALRNL